MNANAYSPRMLLRLSVGAAILLALTAASCGGPKDAVTKANNSAALPANGSAVNADLYRVRAETAAFYHISPLQASGPDEQLKKDSEVMVLQHSRPYCRVKIASGDSGYVANEDIGPLTEGEIASANVSSVQAQLEAQRQAAARSMGGSGYTIPPEAGNQEKLPEPDARPSGPRTNATPTPNPIFHQS